ncbi:MAG: hypothetical protein ACTSQI_17265 [Candidatus Helarchaeota archaeon]
MATESPAEFSTVSKESAKLVLNKEEDTQLSKKELIVLGIGYASIVFMVISLFFPLWVDNTIAPNNSFLSLWRLTALGAPFYHWEILWNYQLFLSNFFYIFISTIVLTLLIVIILLLAKTVWKLVLDDWKTPVVRSSLFGIALGAMLILIPSSFLVPEFNIYNYGLPGIYTVLYGPSWGLSFGWYALLFSGICAIIYKRINEMIEKTKEEEKEGFLT